MSWMDSWSRPSKSSAVPPPLYLTSGEDIVPYCHTCGRVISSRKSKSTKSSPVVKYCSDRCKSHKPGPVDRRIEAKIVSLLNGEKDSGIDKTDADRKYVKGDRRVIVTCGEIEEIVFGSRHDPEKVFGRRKNRATRALGGIDPEWKSVDMEDCDEVETGQQLIPVEDDGHPSHAGLRIRPPQTMSDVNGSVGGEKGWAERTDESPEDVQKRLDGQKRAEEREVVRRAARRGVVFGFLVESSNAASGSPTAKSAAHRRNGKLELAEVQERALKGSEQRRKCEAIMNGAVVEPSFAKGDWAIRWRE